jgi:glutathione synthase/RimK-type ligase-like ATP-grasp enzyme
MSVGLVTHAGLPGLTEDDRLLAEELRGRHVSVRPAVWDDKAVEWAAFDAVVLRSCWDYHHHTDRFLEWLAEIESAVVRLWNPAPLVRGNIHKSYLRELAREGIPVLPTIYLPRESTCDLSGLLEEQGWEEAVVKPAVSASAFGTSRVSRDRARDFKPELDTLLAGCDVLVQLFAPEIRTRGEWSVIFIDGEYSHSVLKKPAHDDFRVQLALGGTVSSESPGRRIVDEARRIAAGIPRPWLYARIDGLERDGKFMLMELELIEPVLYFANDPFARGRLADAILSRAA